MTLFTEDRIPDPSLQRTDSESYAAGCEFNQLSTLAGVPRDNADAPSEFRRIGFRSSGWLRHS